MQQKCIFKDIFKFFTPDQFNSPVNRAVILLLMGGWGLGAINTCVILLLPQSVNSMRRGGGKGAMIGTESQKLVWYASSIQERHLPLESSSSCTSCTTCTSTTALLLCIQQRHCPLKTCPQCLCLSMPCSSSLLLKSAIFSFE